MSGVVRESKISGIGVGQWTQIVTDGVYIQDHLGESIEHISLVKIYAESGEQLSLSREYIWVVTVDEQAGRKVIRLAGAMNRPPYTGGIYLTMEMSDQVRNEARLVGGELQLRGHRADTLDLGDERLDSLLDHLFDLEYLDVRVKRQLLADQQQRGGWYKWRPIQTSFSS